MEKKGGIGIIIVVIVILILIGSIIGVIVWGNITAWGKSFTDTEELKAYCTGLCEGGNLEKYCTKKVFYKYDGGAIRVSCINHALNNRADFCDATDCKEF